MSNSAYDVFLDRCIDEFYEEDEETDLCFDDEPATYPEYDYDERYEDYFAIVEHCFDVEPMWNYDLDLEYAQGEM